MLELIRTRFDARNPVTSIELVDLLQTHRQISISSDTVRHAIRNLETVKSLLGTPMKVDRVTVKREERQWCFEQLWAELAGVRRGFTQR
jgi:FAD synthase